MAVTVGVDFGTRGIEICQKDKGIILREPNVAAVDTKGNVVAVGTEALLIRGRAPGTVTVRRPFTDNNITDFNLTAEILDRCLEAALPRVRKNVIASVKYGLSSQSREILKKALGDCRTGKITLVDSSVAAYYGCGLSPSNAEQEDYSGTIVCDIGAGSIEAAYIRSGELLRAETSFGGGDASDAAIITYLRSKYSLSVTPAAAREAKHALSLVDPEPEPIVFSGIDSATGMPRRITVPAIELLNDCTPHIDDAASTMATLIKNLPHHGSFESSVKNIVLVGGGALTEGIDEYFSHHLEREVRAAADPLDAVVRGLCTMIDSGKIPQ